MSSAAPVRGVCIVGSVTVELEKSYRLMLLKIANELTHDECQQIAFVAKLPSPTCVEEPGKPQVRLHLMSTLESHGHIGPLKLDFLEETLEAVGKKCLLEIIKDYKKTSIYKEAKKRVDDQMKKKKITQKTPKPFTSLSDHALECSVAVKQLLALKEDAKMRTFKDAYATFLTQFSQMALLMRSSVESGDLAQMEGTFVSVASDGDAITRTLRKNLVEGGIMNTSDSDHSDNSPVHSPITEEGAIFVSESETVTSPPPITTRPINSTQRVTVQPSHESSPSPSSQRKKPIPLPRKKWPPPGSSRSSSPVPSPRSPVASKFVYCQQETQLPASLLATADFHIPHSASTSCLTSSADYSGDYSGGTGDSGVGDIKQQYPLSKKSLDDLDPDKQQHQHDRVQNERSHYAKLNVPVKTNADGYTDLMRSRSLEDFLERRHQSYGDYMKP